MCQALIYYSFSPIFVILCYDEQTNNKKMSGKGMIVSVVYLSTFDAGKYFIWVLYGKNVAFQLTLE